MSAAPANLFPGGAIGLALACTAAAMARAVPERACSQAEPSVRASALELSARLTLVLCAVGLMSSSTAIWALDGPLHFVVAAAVAGAIASYLVYESVVFNSARVVLLRPGWKRRAVAATSGLAVGSWTFWLLSTAIWVDGTPASTSSVLAAIAMSLIPSLAIAICAGLVLWHRTTAPRRRMHEFTDNLIGDQLLYGLAIVFAVVLPAASVARLDQLGVPGRGLLALPDILSVAAMGTAFYAFLAINYRHAQRERCMPAPDALVPLARDPRKRCRINRRRVKRLRRHVRRQNAVATTLFVAGGGWVVLRVCAGPGPW